MFAAIHTPSHTLDVEVLTPRSGATFAAVTVWPVAATPKIEAPVIIRLDLERLTRLRDALNQAVNSFHATK